MKSKPLIRIVSYHFKFWLVIKFTKLFCAINSFGLDEKVNLLLELCVYHLKFYIYKPSRYLGILGAFWSIFEAFENLIHYQDKIE